MAKVMRWGLEWEDGRTPEQVEEDDRRNRILHRFTQEVMVACLEAGIQLESVFVQKKTNFWTDETALWIGGRVIPDTAETKQRTLAVVRQVIATRCPELKTVVSLLPKFT